MAISLQLGSGQWSNQMFHHTLHESMLLFGCLCTDGQVCDHFCWLVLWWLVGSIQFSTGKKICTSRFCIFSKVYDPLFRNLKSPHKSGMGKFFYDVIIGQSPIITGQTLIARKIQNFWCHQISKWIKYSNSPRSADEKNGIICQNWITRTHVNNPFKLQ